MKAIGKLFAIILLMSCCQSFAESAVGNGGDVVVCRDSVGRIASIELLDYYEGRLLRGFEASLPTGENATEVALSTVQRLALFSPERAQFYADEVQSFIQNASFLNGITLVDINDSDHLFFPNGCRVEQIAVQRTPEFPGDRRFVINNDLWEKLTVQGQAGLILHEIIYKDALSHGALNSKGTRYLNSLISSGMIDSLSQSQYLEIIRSVFGESSAYQEIGIPKNLCNQQSHTKIMFIVDKSGSNLVTDPDGSVRWASIQKFFEAHANNKFCQWSLVTFQGPSSGAQTGTTFVNNPKAFRVVLNQSRNALDQGGTPFGDALSTAEKVLTTSSSDHQPTLIFFITDGLPTPELTNPAAVALVTKMTHSVRDRVVFDTIHYGTPTPGTTGLLTDMATAGKGAFLELGATVGPVDFDKLILGSH